MENREILTSENLSRVKERVIANLAKIESGKGYGYLQSEIYALPYKEADKSWPEKKGLREYCFTKTTDNKDHVRVYRGKKYGEEKYITLVSGDLFKTYKTLEKKDK